jgi:hypothetical protein
VIAQVHRTHVTTKMNPVSMQESLRTAYLGAQPPADPDTYRDILQDELKAFAPNEFPLGDDAQLVVDAEGDSYEFHYYPLWVKTDLPSGASAELVDWQNAERAKVQS